MVMVWWRKIFEAAVWHYRTEWRLKLFSDGLFNANDYGGIIIIVIEKVMIMISLAISPMQPQPSPSEQTPSGVRRDSGFG